MYKCYWTLVGYCSWDKFTIPFSARATACIENRYTHTLFSFIKLNLQTGHDSMYLTGQKNPEHIIHQLTTMHMLPHAGGGGGGVGGDN